MDPTLGINASFIQTNSCTNIDPIKCIGLGLYGFEDDGSFTQWLVENPYEEDEVTVHFIEAIELLDLDDDCLDLATLVDDISMEDVYGLEIDGTQVEDTIMKEETILPSPLHFQQTSDGLQVSLDVSIYPSVPNDWYHGPTDLIHVIENDWVKVPIHREDEEPKYVKFCSQLNEEELGKYKTLVMEYQDIFAWSYKDLKGIPPEIAQHKIPLISGTKLVQQKNRRLNPKMQLVVEDPKLERLLQASFIRPIELTDWLSHIVLVKKKGGNKLRVCVDYRDLNIRTLKDHFPLPFISTIVDEVARTELYSFMDGYSGYNHVSIAPEDWHKTTFTSPWGTLGMPFGLCNALAAFQIVMTYAFFEFLRKSMVVFIDDFNTQTSQEEHLEMLRACFQRCREVGISLNPEKVYLAVV